MPDYTALGSSGLDPAAVYDAGQELLDVLNVSRPAWHASAACRGMGPSMFFPERGQALEPAREVCERCPVREPCLATALAAGPEEPGVWAGTSKNDRRQLRRRRRRTDAA